jgi:hypothetical protein
MFQPTRGFVLLTKAREGLLMSRRILVLWIWPALFLFSASGLAEGNDWHAEKGYRWSDLKVPAGGKTGFTLLGPEVTGVAFTNLLDERAAEANRVLANGAGVAAGDYDGDGLPDLFFCGLSGRNVLYKNLGGLKFKDVTAESGIACTNTYCRGAVFADINGDGRLDLLVATTGGGVRCFINEGAGRFTDQTAAAGTATSYGSVTMALADVDGDGTLDLYVVNNRTDDIRDRGEVDLKRVNGRLTIPPALADRLVILNGKVHEYGEPSFLYLNDGHGRFKEVSWTNGVFLTDDGRPMPHPPWDWGLTATFRDMNGDGLPDLYVCNDYWTPDRIWINDGSGHFWMIGKTALRNTSASSMGIDFADLNRTGNPDFLVVDMLSRDPALRKRQMYAQNPIASPLGAIENRPQFMRNTLQHAWGDGEYAEIANFAGLTASDWAWSPVFIDVDLDGYEDVLITAGHTRDVQDLDAEREIKASTRPRNNQADPQARHETFLREKIEHAKFYPRLDMPVAAFHNLGNYKFEEVTKTWGTDALAVHHAMAMADLDGDGDLDFVVNNLDAVAGIYRNETSAPRVAVRLKGAGGNTQGIGAKVKLLGGAVPMQSQEVVSGGHYMAGCDPELVFAAGEAAGGMTLRVDWRSGRVSVIAGIRPNCLYEIDEAGASPSGVAKRVEPAGQPPLFEDASAAISHGAAEESFNDFERQPLLPRKLSQLGPGVAWGDLDGDGREDLVIGGGKGGQLAVFHNEGGGEFKAVTNGALAASLGHDLTTVLFWSKTDGTRSVLAGTANYEDGNTNSAAVSEYGATKSEPDPVVAGQPFSAGPLAMADFDGDGILDLFVGGRVIAERYPEAASSLLYRGNGSAFRLDVENSKLLEGVGLVSSAVWSDINGDGYPDLILACEWGPIRVYLNHAGKLIDATGGLGLASYTGWWNGVAAGDFDGDGRMDLVVSNWGQNTPYKASTQQPARLYYGDLADRGTVEIVETEFDPIRQRVEPRRMRDNLTLAIPDIAERFPTYKSYSEASVMEVLGSRLSKAKVLEATTLSSMVFLNRGGRFEAVPLPDEAQWTPGFAVNVADFDGDGYEDLFLSQNFFANQPEVPRMDAGRGLLLLGDGSGHFKAMPGQKSGIKVYGEQRGAAVCDYDGDGRVDLVVTQNGAATKLYRNRRAKPGLRVRLKGPKGNPDGVGATIRLKMGDRLGPAREIHAGSGYWSQDSAVQVLGGFEAATAVSVRWPGGAVTETVIPPGAKELVIDAIAGGR